MNTEQELKMFSPILHKIENGELKCKFCNKPITFTKTDMEKYPIMPNKCDCVIEKIKSEEQKLKDDAKAFKISQIKSNSLMGARYENANFNNIDYSTASKEFVSVVKDLCSYCRNDLDNMVRGLGIYLVSGCGQGKTYLTASMANYLMDKLRVCYFTNFELIGSAVKATFGTNRSDYSVIKSYAECDYLFIDDFGVERFKSNGEDTWLSSIIYEIVNLRYNNKKPIVFSSNNTLKQCVEKGLDIRVADRICETCKIIKLNGENYRIKNKKGGS